MRRRALCVWVAIATAVWLAGCGGSGGGGGTDGGMDGSNGMDALACPSGQTMCSGACVDTSVDLHDCGGCGTTCGAGEVCSGGACATSCGGGQTMCSGRDGGAAYCASLATDNANCGSCGTTCAAGQVCSGGACATTCGGALTECGSGSSAYCASLMTDNTNCGACGTTCASGEVCSGGSCGLSCGGSTPTLCGTACVDTDTDPNNCGACGNACAAGEVCSSGSCVLSCPLSTPNECSGGCFDFQTDPNHCGGCGTSCGPYSNALAACIGSNCYEICNTGYLDCSGTGAGGCTVDGQTDPSNCNGCGNACGPYTNATATCTNGACGYMCNGGYLDCDGASYDGCEIDGDADVNHCGSCSTVCPTPPNATPTCTGGVCGSTCKSGYTDCASGCVSVSSDPNNCNACGHACPAGPGRACGGGVCNYTLATGQSYPFGLATDGTYVYWTDSNGTVWKVGRDGKGLTPLASGQSSPIGIAIDGTYVYWSDCRSPGTIMAAIAP